MDAVIRKGFDDLNRPGILNAYWRVNRKSGVEIVSPKSSAIATRRLRGSSAKHGDIDIVVRIGEPYRTKDSDWACPVAVDGLQVTLADQHGVDSFQALMLAQRLARTLLEGFIADGGVLKDADESYIVEVGELFEGGA